MAMRKPVWLQDGFGGLVDTPDNFQATSESFVSWACTMARDRAMQPEL